MTNRAWINSMNNEEFYDFILKKAAMVEMCGGGLPGFIEWLGQQRDIRVGDVCRYKRGDDKFLVTRIYTEEGKSFFDAVYADGSVIQDGSLGLIEGTGKRIPQAIDMLKMELR